MADKKTKHIPDHKEAGKKGKNNEIYNKSGGQDHNQNSDLQTNTAAGSTDNKRFVSHQKNMETTGDSSAMGSAKAYSFEQFTKNKLGDASSAKGHGGKGSINENKKAKKQNKTTVKDINEKIDAIKASWGKLEKEIKSVINKSNDSKILNEELNDCKKYMKKAFERSNEIKSKLNESDDSEEDEEDEEDEEKKDDKSKEKNNENNE